MLPLDRNRTWGLAALGTDSKDRDSQSFVCAVTPGQNGDAEGATLVVRSRIAPESLASSVLATLRSLNPGPPAAEFRPLQMLVDHSVSPRRFFVLLVTIFAGLGVLLAALGIYGVISYSVTQKTQEIGVRMALGASAARGLREVMTDTLRVTLAGIALGTVTSLVVALIAPLLFSTSPWDMRTFLTMATAVLTVALISGMFRRDGSRVSPMIALRNN